MGHGATPLSTSVTLVKNVVGAAILAVPSAIATYSPSLRALVPTVAITIVLGTLSGYCFVLIGLVSDVTGAKTYTEAYTLSVGRRSAWLPAASCLIKPFFGLWVYSIIIGDSFSSILAGAGAPAWASGRVTALLAVTVVVLLPLCLLRSLKALSFTSFLGLAAMLYVAGFMAFRLHDGSYAPGGQYDTALDETGAGSTPVNQWALLLIIDSLGTAFTAHYNAPRWYAELADPSIPRFSAVAAASFAFSALLYAFMASVGFLTFGAVSEDNILNNYADDDPLASVARALVALSVTFTYPLLLVGVRDGLLGLAKVPNPAEPGTAAFLLSTVAILSASTLLAVFVRNMGFAVSFGGAVLASAIIYVFPAAMVLGMLGGSGGRGYAAVGRETESGVKGGGGGSGYAAVERGTESGGQGGGRSSGAGTLLTPSQEKSLIWSSRIILVLGIAMGTVGGVVSVLKSFTNVFDSQEG